MDPQQKPLSSSNEPTDGDESTSDSGSFDAPTTQSLPDDSTVASTDDMSDDSSLPSQSDDDDVTDSHEQTESGDNAGSSSASSSESPASESVESPADEMSSQEQEDDKPVEPAIVDTQVPQEATSSPIVPDTQSPAMASPTPSPSSAMDAAPVVMGDSKKTKKPLIIGIIIAAIIIILLGASAAAYYVVMNKPQNVLNTALMNSFSGKVSSETFDGNFAVKTNGTTYTTTFSGGANQSGAFTLTGKIDALVTTVGIDIRSTDGQTVYARVSGLDGVSQLLKDSQDPTLSLYAPILNDVNNQWIQINQSMIEQLTGSSSNTTTKLTSSDMQQLGAYYKKDPFMTVQKSLPAQTIAGKSSYHYQVVVDKAKLQTFLNDAKSIHDLNLTQSDLTTLNKALQKANLTSYPIDIWVAKSSKLVDQVSFNTTTSDKTTMSVRFTVDSTNQPVTVTAPANSKSLLDLISGLLSGTGLDTSSLLANGNSVSL